MERVGLVERVEAELERDISLGMLPRDGRLASQAKLARSFGVSRSTVREALRRLEARGLVVLHPGRQTRAVVLDEALTLENLGVALHDERSEEGRRLLEGYFSLKRQVTLELLADCCANASEPARQRLAEACYALRDAARWEPVGRCAQLEYELLKLAARAVDRPGHLLLIQSLFRALEGIAARVLPLVNREALRQWAHCAMNALDERAPEALKQELPPLLMACDGHVPGELVPAQEEEEAREAHRLRQQPLPEEPPSEAPAQGTNPSEPDEDCAGRPAGDGSPQPDCQSDRFVHFATEEAPQPQPQPQPASAGGLMLSHVTVRGPSESPHGANDPPPPSPVPEGGAPRAAPLPTSELQPEALRRLAARAAAD